MKIGYARVSKADGSQNLELQKDALLKEGVIEKDIYEDHISGRKDGRAGLESCLKALRKGDTLVGRNLKPLMNTVQDLSNRKVGFKVLAGQGCVPQSGILKNG